jgi:hypothetical protein
MTLRDLVQSCGWPDDGTRELAQRAAAALLGIGLGRDAVLVWIDQVYAQPNRFLSDLLLAPLARARLAAESPSARDQAPAVGATPPTLHQLYQSRKEPKDETCHPVS